MSGVALPRVALIAVLALALGACLFLGVRVAGQLSTLADLKSDAELRERLAVDETAHAGAPVGRPLLAASREISPADELARQLGALGFKVSDVHETGRRGAGAGVALAAFSVDGAADAPALGRLAQWLERNGQSAALDRLALKAGAAAAPLAPTHLDLEALVAVRP